MLVIDSVKKLYLLATSHLQFSHDHEISRQSAQLKQKLKTKMKISALFTAQLIIFEGFIL